MPSDVGPGPHAHRDRWRARVNRVDDLSAITFDDQGVRLPGGPVRAWREPPKEQPARPALHAALARLCRCTTPEEASESFLAAGLFPSHFADDATRVFDVSRSFEWGPPGGSFLCHDRFEVRVLAESGRPYEVQLHRAGHARAAPIPWEFVCIGADARRAALEPLERLVRQWPHPRNMRDWLAWSSLGAAQIEQAEQLARDAAERLRPFGLKAPVAAEKADDGTARTRALPWRVEWCVTAKRSTIVVAGKPKVHTWNWPVNANGYGGSHAVWDAWREKRIAAGDDETLAWWAAHVDAWPQSPDAHPCPHEPVLALLRMGLFLDAIRPRERALVLAVPPLPQET